MPDAGKGMAQGSPRHGYLLRGSAPPFRRDRIFRSVVGSNRKRGSEPCGPVGLSGRHVSHDADDDEREKIESMLSKLWIKLGLVIAIVGGIAALLA